MFFGINSKLLPACPNSARIELIWVLRHLHNNLHRPVIGAAGVVFVVRAKVGYLMIAMMMLVARHPALAYCPCSGEAAPPIAQNCWEWDCFVR